MLLSPALSTRMRAVDLIRKKRDSGELSHEEIDFLVSGYTRGEIPDYQMAAWLMAAWIRGMNRAELAALPMLARGSALRFLLTRLYDLLNQTPGALVKPKDPIEFLKKLSISDLDREKIAHGNAERILKM